MAHKALAIIECCVTTAQHGHVTTFWKLGDRLTFTTGCNACSHVTMICNFFPGLWQKHSFWKNGFIFAIITFA